MTVRSLAGALKAAITAKGPTALDFDEAQNLEDSGSLPDIHVLVTLTRRFGGNGRVTTHKTVAGWRLTTTAVGTTVDEARWAAEKVALLEFTRVAASGYDLSPLMFETQNPPEPDSGLFSGVTSWTFTSTPTP